MMICAASWRVMPDGPPTIFQEGAHPFDNRINDPTKIPRETLGIMFFPVSRCINAGPQTFKAESILERHDEVTDLAGRSYAASQRECAATGFVLLAGLDAVNHQANSVHA